MSNFQYCRNIKLPKDKNGKHICIFYSCKSGCSTLKNFSVLNFYQDDIKKTGQNVWEFFDAPKSKDYVFNIFSEEERLSKEFQDSYKIWVIRDPVDRLISFYKNKVCDDQYNEYFNENKDVCYFRNCSFKEMVEELHRIVCINGVDIDKIGNVHLISQIYGIKDIMIDSIFRIEDINTMVGLLNRKYEKTIKYPWIVGKSGSIKQEEVDNNISYFDKKCNFFRDKNKKLKFPNHSFFINYEILKKIEDIYLIDYKNILKKYNK